MWGLSADSISGRCGIKPKSFIKAPLPTQWYCLPTIFTVSSPPSLNCSRMNGFGDPIKSCHMTLRCHFPSFLRLWSNVFFLFFIYQTTCSFTVFLNFSLVGRFWEEKPRSILKYLTLTVWIHYSHSPGFGCIQEYFSNHCMQELQLCSETNVLVAPYRFQSCKYCCSLCSSCQYLDTSSPMMASRYLNCFTISSCCPLILLRILIQIRIQEITFIKLIFN